mgnify:CR=1 FL=1
MYKILTEFFQRFFKPATIYKYGFNWSPMYRRTTARLIEVSDDLHRVVIRLKPSWKNRNYTGTIFGGSMLSATDPIYMIQLLQILGKNYVVWDKAVEARYRKPAKTIIYGEFEFSSAEISDIIQKVSDKKEIDVFKTMHLTDIKKNIIATFNKTIYVADKKFYNEKLRRRKSNNKK